MSIARNSDYCKMSAAVYDLRYLPGICWVADFAKCEEPWLEREENFVKSTFRNRCEIAGAGGKLTLSIPVTGGRDHHRLYKDTRIAYQTNWQSNHWQSIRSAYGSAPYFEFYYEKFQKFYEREYRFLFDFNLELLQTALTILKLNSSSKLTETYEPEPIGMMDRRSGRKGKTDMQLPVYYQVFANKYGFIPDLSILDLIFNLGPDAKEYLGMV